MTRGMVLAGIDGFIGKRYDEATARRLRDGYSPELKAALRDVKIAAWYPRAHFIELNRAVGSVAGNDSAYDDLLSAGHNIAEIATNTFMKLLLRMLTPRMFAKKFPDFWKRDNKGGYIQMDPTSKLEEDQVVFFLKEVEAFDHIGPVAAGFISYALGAITSKKVGIKVHGWTYDRPAPAEIRYDVSW
ncbi:MAG TPA: hypothetical protein VIV40_17900 [Kofleriaceae bacterium]